MLSSIRRNGTGAEPLKPYVSAAVKSWWKGQADAGQINAAQALLLDLHSRSRWLSCSCAGNTNDCTSWPYLAPAKIGETIFLRRMNNRQPHANTCTFWHDLVDRQTAEPSHHSPLLAVHGKAPSFILDDADELKISQYSSAQSDQNETTPGNARPPRQAARLFWLAQESGFQRAPSDTPPVSDLLKTAQSVPVGPSLNLKNLLYCNIRAWSESWYKTAFKQCINAGIAPACWLIQLAVGFDLKSRIITYTDENQKLLQVPVNGEMKVFGGDTSAARFPLLVIALIRKVGDNTVVQSAYAHPVLEEKRWMLVDSDLERKTYRDLARICGWLKEEMGICIEIEKPLYAWRNTNERPDFILNLTSKSGKLHHFVVETMGFEDPLYEARKSALTANVDCAVFLDRRAEMGNSSNMELATAVAYWAGRLSDDPLK